MSDPSAPLTFNCPTCGSPLTPPGDDSTSMSCPACSNTVVIPETMRTDHPAGQDALARKKAVMHELMRQLGNGNKIAAIKSYRAAFGVSLVEAKTAIETLEAGGGLQLPELLASYQPDPSAVRARVPAPPARKAKPSKIGSVIFWTLILLILGGVVYSAVSSGSNAAAKLSASVLTAATEAKPGVDSIFSRPPTYLDPAVLIPVGDAPSDVVTQARRFDQDPYTTSLVRLSSTTGKIVWETAPFPGKDVTVDDLFTDGLRVFSLVKDSLSAYQAEDGKPLWQTTLSDKLGYCGTDKDCVLNYQSVFLVLTTDDNLQALDATTGKKLWEFRTSGSNNGIRMLKDQVVVTGKDEKKNTDFLTFLDFKTGKEAKRVSPQGYYGYSQVFFDQDSLYLNQSSSFEKWDLSTSTPKLVWSKDNSKYDTSSSDSAFLGKDFLFMVASHALISGNLSTGDMRLFVQNGDYEFQPLVEQDDQLIVLARRTRGTEKFEIWPVNIQSGEVGQTLTLGESTLYHDSYENVSGTKYVWTWQVVNGNLVLVKFQDSPNQITIESINLKTGKSNPTLTIPLSKITDDSYGVRSLIGWQRHYLFVMLETEVYAVDVEKGSLILSTP